MWCASAKAPLFPDGVLPASLWLPSGRIALHLAPKLQPALPQLSVSNVKQWESSCSLRWGSLLWSPQLSKGLALKLKALQSPFLNRAAQSKPLAWLCWYSWTRARWNPWKKKILNAFVTLRIGWLVLNSRHLKLNPDRVRAEAKDNIAKYLYTKGFLLSKLERKIFNQNYSSSQRTETGNSSGLSYLAVGWITDNHAKLSVKSGYNQIIWIPAQYRSWSQFKVGWKS